MRSRHRGTPARTPALNVVSSTVESLADTQRVAATSEKKVNMWNAATECGRRAVRVLFPSRDETPA